MLKNLMLKIIKKKQKNLNKRENKSLSLYIIYNNNKNNA